jgi:hypothetical protein
MDLGDAIEAAGVPPLTQSRRWLAYGPDCFSETLADEESRDDEVIE